MLNKQSIKDLIASSLVGYHTDILPGKINELIATHNNFKATSTQDGHMTAAQVKKLEGIKNLDGEKNQNAFSNVKVGTATITAGTATDTVEIAAGSNMSVTADAETKKVTIAGAYQPFSATAEGLVPSPASKANTNFLSTSGWKEIQSASTTAKGIVKLVNSTESDSVADAATAKSVASALTAAKGYTDTKISDLIAGAPDTLDTLKEIADQLNKDDNQTIVGSLFAQISTKADAGHTHKGADLAIGTYTVPDAVSDVAVTDTIAAALAKVDKRARTASAGSDKWNTARTINVKGAATGSVSLDGSKNVELTLTLANLSSDKVNAMTGYTVPTKAPTSTAIAAADSLNAAIGKLEYRLNTTNMDSMIGTLTANKTLADYKITDAYSLTAGNALAGRVKTIEDNMTTLGGVESVDKTDVAAVIEAVKTALKK